MKKVLIIVSDIESAYTVEAKRVRVASADSMLVDLDNEWQATILTADAFYDALVDKKMCSSRFDMLEIDTNELSDNALSSLLSKVIPSNTSYEEFLPNAQVRFYGDVIGYEGVLYKVDLGTLVTDVSDMLDGLFERGYLEEL
jgi:hypothetical protein